MRDVCTISSLECPITNIFLCFPRFSCKKQKQTLHRHGGARNKTLFKTLRRQYEAEKVFSLFSICYAFLWPLNMSRRTREGKTNGKNNAAKICKIIWWLQGVWFCSPAAHRAIGKVSNWIAYLIAVFLFTVDHGAVSFSMCTSAACWIFARYQVCDYSLVLLRPIFSMKMLWSLRSFWECIIWGVCSAVCCF